MWHLFEGTTISLCSSSSSVSIKGWLLNGMQPLFEQIQYVCSSDVAVCTGVCWVFLSGPRTPCHFRATLTLPVLGCIHLWYVEEKGTIYERTHARRSIRACLYIHPVHAPVRNLSNILSITSVSLSVLISVYGTFFLPCTVSAVPFWPLSSPPWSSPMCGTGLAQCSWATVLVLLWGKTGMVRLARCSSTTALFRWPACVKFLEDETVGWLSICGSIIQQT